MRHMHGCCWSAFGSYLCRASNANSPVDTTTTLFEIVFHFLFLVASLRIGYSIPMFAGFVIMFVSTISEQKMSNPLNPN